MPVIRPMSEADVDAALELTNEAFADLDRRLGEEPAPFPDPATATIRYRDLVRRDPGGSWVAEDEHGLAGCALALLREGVWGLSLLVVAPRAQSGGIGRALLDRTLGYGAPHRGGIILSSDDPRAIRAYARAGFDLHPSVRAHGTPRAVAPASGVREGGHDDLALTAAVDRETRGGARTEDVAALLAAGCRLLVHPDRGYVAVTDGVVRTLSARDDEAARDLLVAALATTPPDARAGVEFLTGGQDWAFGVALDAGLALEPCGPVFTRGTTGSLRPYVPSGAYL